MSNSLTETTEISIVKIRDQDSESTCEYEKQCCPFLMVSRFGTREHCFWEENDAFIRRRDNGIGTLIPHKACPVWKSHRDNPEVQ